MVDLEFSYFWQNEVIAITGLVSVAADLLLYHYRPSGCCHGPSALPLQACPPRWLDGELLLLVRAFCPVQRRRTDAVLLLRSIAALVGPAGPFPPIRPKACHGIARSVRATVAKYPPSSYWK